MTSSQEPAAGVDLARLLGRDYWLVRSLPRPGTTADAVAACVQEHVAWLLDLERRDVLLASGPLLSGPGTGPGSGVTILRAPDEETARKIADGDPFVRHGLRTFELYRWPLNEGSISVRVSLGTGTYDWQ